MHWSASYDLHERKNSNIIEVRRLPSLCDEEQANSVNFYDVFWISSSSSESGNPDPVRNSSKVN